MYGGTYIIKQNVALMKKDIIGMLKSIYKYMHLLQIASISSRNLVTKCCQDIASLGETPKITRLM